MTGGITLGVVPAQLPIRAIWHIPVVSGAGRATVDVQSVDISGLTIDGKMLDYLIDNYLPPKFPEAKVGRPFELAHHIDRLEVKPNGVDVVASH